MALVPLFLGSCSFLSGVKAAIRGTPKTFASFTVLSGLFVVSLVWTVEQQSGLEVPKPAKVLSVTTHVLIAVATSIWNNEQRQLIRSTWGQLCNDNAKLLNPITIDYPYDQLVRCTIKFVVGGGSGTLKDVLIENETRLHTDIIKGPFEDSYDTLAEKSLYILGVFVNDSEYTHLLKIDDDCYLSIPLLRRRLLACRNVRELFIGNVMSRAQPINGHNRSHAKWYVSEKEFDHRFYPTYFTGAGYLMSKSVGKCLVENSRNEAMFKFEDVFITGICAWYCPVQHRHDPGFVHSWQLIGKFRPKKGASWRSNLRLTLDVEHTVMYHDVDEKHMRMFNDIGVKHVYGEHRECPGALPL